MALPDDGYLVWITGLSGAGKTSVAISLADRIKARTNIPPVLIDGDEMREVTGDLFGYTPQERLKLAYMYARLSRKLCLQGHCVICSTISMFDEVRQWNRENIDKYTEVFLDVPGDVRMERNIRSGKDKDQKAGAVSDSDYELPQASDIVIANHGDITAVDAANRIMVLLEQ